MSDIAPELATELDALVRGLPGVLQTYPARPALLTAVAEAATAVLRVPVSPAAAPVSFTRDADGISVRVAIAVSEEFPAAQTCRAVHDAVAARLAEVLTDPVARVSVEVARIG